MKILTNDNEPITCTINSLSVGIHVNAADEKERERLRVGKEERDIEQEKFQ